MKKLTILLSLICVSACIAFSGFTAVYAIWGGNFTSNKNTVKVGTYVSMTMEDIDEFEASQGFCATFTVSKYDPKSYNLVLSGIKLYEADEESTDWTNYIDDVWEYSLSESGTWIALTSTDIQLESNVSHGDEVQIWIRQKADASADYKLGTLVFVAKLEEVLP